MADELALKHLPSVLTHKGCLLLGISDRFSKQFKPCSSLLAFLTVVSHCRLFIMFNFYSVTVEISVSNTKLIDASYTDFYTGRVFPATSFIVNILLHLSRKNLNVFILMLSRHRPQGHRIEIETIWARSCYDPEYDHRDTNSQLASELFTRFFNS